MDIRYEETNTMPKDLLEGLYLDAQWYAYTKDMTLLQDAFSHSLRVVSAWQENHLIGLIRVIGDGLTIIYIQDILVLKSHQNLGIGSELLKRVMNEYKDVRQKVLLTEEDPNLRQFYEKNGFSSCDQGSLVAFAHIT